MNEASYTLEDAAEGLRSAVDDEDSYPGELDDVEARLDQLYRLSLKYGSDEAEMLAFLEDAQAWLDQIENADAHRARLEEEYIAAGTHAKELALALSEKREQVGEVFVQRVTEELAYLDMPRVRLEIAHEYGNLNATGCDRIEFRISTNPGEPPKPLTKIASGGEMSRLMLAIKNVLADKDEIDTLIFDEVDTGISGRAALKVGRKLRQVAEDRQVLCVTHLAQIAAHAHAHLLIEKKVRGERTATQVRALEREGRRQELARIMSGTDQPTELQLHSAEELLETAENA
jgi:DNA repair protein RecN (Recombination protein N)